MSDKIFDALAHEQRRQLLFSLLEHNPQNPANLSAPSEDSSEPAEEAISRHHVHLPKLVDYGYIEWNRDADIVTKGPRFDEIRPLLEFLRSQQE